MAHRGFVSGRGRSSQRRATSWVFGPGGQAATAISASGQQIVGSGLVLIPEGATLVRTRGFVELVLEAAANIGEGISGAFGIGLVTNEAFAIGATAIPGPLSEMDWDGWLYHQFWSLHASTATIADGVNVGRYGFDVDSKAMRKWDTSMTLVAMVEATEIGVSQVEMFFDSRLLIKLS